MNIFFFCVCSKERHHQNTPRSYPKQSALVGVIQFITYVYSESGGIPFVLLLAQSQLTMNINIKKEYKFNIVRTVFIFLLNYFISMACLVLFMNLVHADSYTLSLLCLRNDVPFRALLRDQTRGKQQRTELFCVCTIQTFIL